MQNESLAYFVRKGRPVVAVSSALGGPVAVIRISGENLDFLQTLTGKFPAANAFRYVSLNSSDGKREFDRALLLYFKAPHSFTGEDVIEIQGHGVPALVEEIVEAVVSAGAERALPGEFSFRAFANGKMDLSDAEKLQTALSTEGLNAAWASKLLSISQGSEEALRKRFESSILSLQSARGRIEAAIDFPEAESEQSVDVAAALAKLKDVKAALNAFLSSYYHFCRSAGESRVVIVGDPNVGKSSLLNALVGGARALVSPVAGTTRDVVEARIKLPSGRWIRLLDTAGIREVSETGDHAVLEKAGIALGVESIASAAVVIRVKSLMKDSVDLSDENLQSLLAPNTSVLELHSFVDQSAKKAINAFKFNSLENADRSLILSLIDQAVSQAEERELVPENDLVISRRQGQLVGKALEDVERALAAVQGQIPLEVAGDALRSAESFLKRCVGQDLSDEYIGQIFSQFCLGK